MGPQFPFWSCPLLELPMRHSTVLGNPYMGGFLFLESPCWVGLKRNPKGNSILGGGPPNFEAHPHMFQLSLLLLYWIFGLDTSYICPFHPQNVFTLFAGGGIYSTQVCCSRLPLPKDGSLWAFWAFRCSTFRCLTFGCGRCRRPRTWKAEPDVQATAPQRLPFLGRGFWTMGTSRKVGVGGGRHLGKKMLGILDMGKWNVEFLVSFSTGACDLCEQ